MAERIDVLAVLREAVARCEYSDRANGIGPTPPTIKARETLATVEAMAEALQAYVNACREQDIKLGSITGDAIAALARYHGGA